jgi:hypothetical protein
MFLKSVIGPGCFMVALNLHQIDARRFPSRLGRIAQMRIFRESVRTARLATDGGQSRSDAAGSLGQSARSCRSFFRFEKMAATALHRQCKTD